MSHVHYSNRVCSKSSVKPQNPYCMLHIVCLVDYKLQFHWNWSRLITEILQVNNSRFLKNFENRNSQIQKFRKKTRMGKNSSKLDSEPRIRQTVLDNVKGHIISNKEHFEPASGARVSAPDRWRQSVHTNMLKIYVSLAENFVISCQQCEKQRNSQHLTKDMVLYTVIIL